MGRQLASCKTVTANNCVNGGAQLVLIGLRANLAIPNHCVQSVELDDDLNVKVVLKGEKAIELVLNKDTIDDSAWQWIDAAFEGLDLDGLKIKMKSSGRKRKRADMTVGSVKKLAMTCGFDEFDQRVFPRQVMAFEYADGLRDIEASVLGQGWDRPKVFGIELGANGKRKFLVSGRGSFFKAYLELLPLSRHVYEIIREDRPCKLYFDLEYSKPVNLDVDGEKLVALVIHLTSLLLFKKFRIVITREECLELDSSSESKFSRHLVIHTPGWLFKNNMHCGTFVKEVTGLAETELQVRGKDGDLVSFIDHSVYSKNRAFRVYLSAKFGKKQILEPAVANCFPCDESTLKGVQDFFESSLICPPVYSQSKLLMMDTVPYDPSSLIYPSPVYPRRIKVQPSGSTPEGDSPCPFPNIEKDILNHIYRNTTPSIPIYPSVRTWELQLDPTTNKPASLILHLRNHRYCHRIGRHHKSNNVFYIFNFETNTFFQRCFDPNCRSFISQSWALGEDCKTKFNTVTNTTCSTLGERCTTSVQQASRIC